MTIELAIQKKIDLAKNIAELLQAFSDETGLEITNVSFNTHRERFFGPPMDGKPRPRYVSVNIEVQL